MTHTTFLPKDKEQRRVALIDAANAVFAERGYDCATTREIAERAGLTKRTFFRYFSDKREVLFSGSHELQRLWLEGLAAAPTDATPLILISYWIVPSCWKYQ